MGKRDVLYERVTESPPSFESHQQMDSGFLYTDLCMPGELLWANEMSYMSV